MATGSEPESEAPAESGMEDEPTPEVSKGHVEFNLPLAVDLQRDAPPNVKVGIQLLSKHWWRVSTYLHTLLIGNANHEILRYPALHIFISI